MDVHRFRRVLGDDLEAPRWPPGLCLLPFEPARYARAVHRMLEDAYASGGGSVPSLAAWWSALSTDAEYDPALVLLAGDRGGTPVAVAICWTSAYVKDIAVDAATRRRGLASCLLRHTFRVFRARGAAAVDLKVIGDNHTAIALYRALGMTCVETLHVPG